MLEVVMPGENAAGASKHGAPPKQPLCLRFR